MGSEEVRHIAKETGFFQRTSKLTPEVFFDLVFYACFLSENSSLEYLVSYLDSQYGIDIRKQSLDERFSDKSVNFVKSVLSRLICEQFSDVLFSKDFLSRYNHVRIKDSTKFNVPCNLASHYRGSGGSGDTSSAGICIQYEFDLKTGKFLDLTLTEAVRNDQTDANETAENVCENDLVIRDLGYFSTAVLQTIRDKKAFFLSRLLSSSVVYDEDNVEFDFKKLHVFMTKNGIEKCERQVFIGNDRLPVRLVIGLVPSEVYQERMRRKEKEAKRRGRKMKEHRYITMLYIRLILIVLNLQIINRVQNLISMRGGKDVILSYRKTLQTLKNSFHEILNILRCSSEKSNKLLGELYRILSKNHWREKRKKRENYVENIYLFICLSEK